MFDGKAFGQEIVAAVKEHIDKTVAPLHSRIADLEKQLAEMPAPKDGKSITIDDVKPMIKAESERVHAELRESTRSAITETIDMLPTAYIGELEAFCKTHIDEQVSLAVAALPPAENGKDADPVEVAAQIKEEVERILAGWDKPQDGKSVTVDELLPAIEERVAKAVAAIPVPKDGINGRDADPAEVARLLAQKANDNYSISDGEFASRVSICLGKVVEIRSSPLAQSDAGAAVAGVRAV